MQVQALPETNDPSPETESVQTHPRVRNQEGPSRVRKNRANVTRVFRMFLFLGFRAFRFGVFGL